MKKFIEKIQKICNENKKVAIFIDMDGTITEYVVYQDKTVENQMGDEYENLEPVAPVIEALEEINKIPNIDLYILSLAKNSEIAEEKYKWLSKYASFIKRENWIVINKEKGEYSSENRNIIKTLKMQEKLNKYDHVILLDDDHKILKETVLMLNDKTHVYHVSSAII